LPVGHKQMIVLMLEGLSHAEIGEVLGITENNVAVRLTRARKALKEEMGVTQ
jgi:RNA polymerase sigma factor (sigma-70 family)